MARKSQYDEKVKPYLDDIKQWIAVTTEKDIAENILQISQATFITYKKSHKELRDALAIGIPKTIVELKMALYQRAVGFRDKVTEKYYPPDPQAAHLLLKNLDKEWRTDDSTTIDLKKDKLEIERKKGIVW